MMDLFKNYPELKPIEQDINNAIDILITAIKHNGKILVCGNGGSASDSAHIVGELMKSFLKPRPIDINDKTALDKEFNGDAISSKLQKGIPCIDLSTQTSLLTAVANDVDSSLIFAQQVYAYSKNHPYDVVIGLSTSGNSCNVINAIKVARALQLKTISLTGQKESVLSKISTVCIKVPAIDTYRIQEYHLPIYHYICAKLEEMI